MRGKRIYITHYKRGQLCITDQSDADADNDEIPPDEKPLCFTCGFND